MTKNELKQLIKETLSELNTESKINVHHKVKLANLKKDGWNTDGWSDKQKGIIKVIRTNPKTDKIETGTIDRKGNFQIMKEVLAEQNALTTLQISTVGGGTTLLLYRGDAKGSERSSDKHYKTPTQFRDLIASLNTTGGMTTDEVIKNILRKLTPEQLKQLVREKIVVSDRVSEFLGEEASTKELQKLGFKPTKSDVNEVKGFVLHWNTPEADYMRRKSVMKPKMHAQFKRMMGTQTMKYDDLVKAFPNSKSIVLKDLPPIPRGSDLDYFTVDEEGDIVPIQQADISSGLD